MFQLTGDWTECNCWGGFLETRAGSRVFLRISNNNLPALVETLLSTQGHYIVTAWPLGPVWHLAFRWSLGSEMHQLLTNTPSILLSSHDTLKFFIFLLLLPPILLSNICNSAIQTNHGKILVTSWVDYALNLRVTPGPEQYNSAIGLIYGHLFSAILHRTVGQSRTPSMIFSRPG